MDLALNNLQRLIWCITQTTNQRTNQILTITYLQIWIIYGKMHIAYYNLYPSSFTFHLVYQIKLKSEKPLASTRYHLKYGRQENLMIYYFDYTTLSINNKKKKRKKWTKAFNLLFPKKGDHGITKNFRGIPLTCKVYNVLLLSYIKLEIQKTLKKKQNSF